MVASRPAAPAQQMLAGVGPEFGIVDYSNTHFHNNLVVKHTKEHPIGGVLSRQDDAFDQADAEILEREA